MKDKRILVAVTGASGAPYACRLLERLARLGIGETLVIISDAGRRLLKEEVGAEVKVGKSDSLGRAPANFDDWLDVSADEADRMRLLPIADIGALPASGSQRLDAMVVAPCSMRTLAAVSHGLADNLITRSADVCIKEGRRLVLVPRETPLSAIHLENMLRLARLGVRIVPACPGFYQGPETINDLIDFVVERTLSQMDLPPDDA